MVNGSLVVITIICCHYCGTGGRTEDSGMTNRRRWMEGQKDRQTDGSRIGFDWILSNASM